MQHDKTSKWEVGGGMTRVPHGEWVKIQQTVLCLMENATHFYKSINRNGSRSSYIGVKHDTSCQMVYRQTLS